MLIRAERPSDVDAIRAVHTEAFASASRGVPVEVGLVDALRASDAWLPALSLVAIDDGTVVGHVVCTRAHVAGQPVLALGPIGVLPARQRSGVGTALMDAVLAAADAAGEPLVALLGHLDYYPRFGFRPSADLGIEPPDPAWGAHFQARQLVAYDPSLRGTFEYAQPFNDL